MPYKSKKQQRYMHAAAARGEIKKSVVREFDAATNYDKLPESSPKRSRPKRRKYS